MNDYLNELCNKAADAIKFVQQSKEKLMSKKKVVIKNLKSLTVMKMVNQKKTR